MASGISNRFKANLMNKVVDLEADTIKVMLLDTNHSFDADDDVITDVSANELASGNGYTTGGAALATKAVTQDDTNDLAKFDADDTAWTSATFSAYFAVIWDDTAADDCIICTIDFGGVKTVTSGTLTLQWSASGIITLA